MRDFKKLQVCFIQPYYLCCSNLIISKFFTNIFIKEDPPAGVSGAPTEDNILMWEAIIFGPQDTPFEDGTFKLTLEFTEEYPNKPPTVKFVSKMFHPNVYADGSICLDILQVFFASFLYTAWYDDCEEERVEDGMEKRIQLMKY